MRRRSPSLRLRLMRGSKLASLALIGGVALSGAEPASAQDQGAGAGQKPQAAATAEKPKTADSKPKAKTVESKPKATASKPP